MVCRPPRSEPQALPGTRSLALPLPLPRRGRGTLPVVLGPEPEDSGCCGGRAGGPCRSLPRPRVFLSPCGASSWWGPVARREAGRGGPGGAVGVRGARPPAASSCGDIHRGGFVCWWPWSQWEGVLPLGGAAGRQSFVASKDLAVSLCGWPHLPRKERGTGHCLPPRCLPIAPGGLARPASPRGTSIRGPVRLRSDPKECPGATEVGGSQTGVHKPAPGVVLPPGPPWLPE